MLRDTVIRRSRRSIVWPFEQRRYVLRIARDRVELWAWSRHGLVPAGQQALSGLPFDAAALRSATVQLLEQPALEGVRQKGRAIEVVVESAWLPVVPIEPGPTLLSEAAVEALLRYRLDVVHGPAGVGALWELQLEHRAGDRAGLGYALPSSVRAALLEAATAAKCRLTSVQPAFAWGRTRIDGRWPRRGWVLWQEHDRTLVAWMHAGRVLRLNAAAAAAQMTRDVQRCVEIESLRQGVDDAQAAPIVVVGWWRARIQEASPRTSWMSVAASAEDPKVAQQRLEHAAT
jgi:hypothetical protein